MNIESLLDLAVQIQQIPAPTFDEGRRAEFVCARFQAEGLTDVQIDLAGNVLARLPGLGTGHPLIISAHLDTVFPLETDLTCHRDNNKISAPGIGDNSLGVAALFGILWELRALKAALSRDIWFAANVCEEGLGDLRGMRAVVDRFGGEVKGYLVLEGMAFGHVYNRGTGVRRFKITARTAGGHSWSDYGKPSAIHELSELVTRLVEIKLPASPRTTLNVGKITGGTSINTIAPDARLELDLRSEDESTLQGLVRRVDELVAGVKKSGVEWDMQAIGQRPAGFISPDHPLIQTALSSLTQLGVEPVLTVGSTDANIPFSKGYPAVVLGVTTGGGAHTSREYIDIAPIEGGVTHLVDVVTRMAK
jgi:acetylornithine deacetylase/succinyl-diaminopimelate desuccinylase-like protein